MAKVFLTPLLIAGLLLLPSCSNSPKPADKPLAKTECEIVSEKALEKGKAVKELQDANQDINNAALLSYFYWIVEESDCFSSELVSQAKSGIALILKQ